MALPKNSVAVESARGLRTLALIEGTVEEAPDAVLVVPSHAAPEFPLTGAVLDVVRERYGIDFCALEPLLTGPGCLGTYRVVDKGAFPGREVLLLRVPGCHSVQESGNSPRDVLDRTFWSLFGSLAALELRQRGLESLALPLVDGTRGYEVRELLGTILEHALAWLRVARDLEAVNIYLVDRRALAEWDATMDTLLGRRSVDAAQDSLVRAIRAELLALIASPRLASFGPEWRPPLERIRSALSTSRIRIEDVAVPARSVAELVAFRYAAPATASPAKMTLAEATSVLRKEGQVAPWIVSHLDCLRYFGNAAAHSQSPVSYRPPGLCEEDLPALLASLHRVIAFHLSPSETVG